METFDIIVIGAGSGGLNVASFMNRIGCSVLLIDRDATSIGGDCLNTGCVPSKALIHVADQIAAGAAAEQFGVEQTGAVDFSAVRAYIRSRQAVIREHENVDYFRAQGMTVVLGEASFTGKDTVRVDGTNYHGKRIVIATGSRPRILELDGREHVPVYTNETIFDMPELPEHLVIIGGGPIGLELGQAFARLGSTVTIVNRDDQWLAKEHRAVVEPVLASLQRDGVRFVADAVVRKITEDKEVCIDTPAGEERLPAEAILLSVGRMPNTEGLALEHAGIHTTEHAQLVLNRYLQTTNSRVFAIGDVAGLHQFTHAAELQASVLLRNFFVPRLFWKPVPEHRMAWVTYTDPEVATFGYQEPELIDEGLQYTVTSAPFTENDRAVVQDDTTGLAQIYVASNGAILGGTMVGKDAGELVGELILAQTHHMRVRDVFARVFPYPTAARINQSLARTYLSGRLTYLIKRILRALY